KLASVVTTVLGVSARAMLKALIAGEGAPEQLAELAQRRLRRKRPALTEALTGRVTAHHRFLLDQLLCHIEFLDGAIAACDRQIATLTAPHADALARLDTIPGVAHSLLVIAYHVLRDGQPYRELGGDYFEHLNADRLTRYHTKRLAALGYAVTLTKCAA